MPELGRTDRMGNADLDASVCSALLAAARARHRDMTRQAWHKGEVEGEREAGASAKALGEMSLTLVAEANLVVENVSASEHQKADSAFGLVTPPADL